MSILAEAARRKLSDRDVVDSLLLSGLSREQADSVLVVYAPLCDRLRLQQVNRGPRLRSYKDLEWRVDVQVSWMLDVSSDQVLCFWRSE